MYTKRQIDRLLFEEQDKQWITVLIGPRRSGKSSTLNNFLEVLKTTQGLPNNYTLTLELDSLSLRSRLEDDETLLVKLMENQAGKPMAQWERKFFLVLDEVQKAPFLLETVKQLYDHHRQQLKIILSGSSSLELYAQSAETLAGRMRYLRQSPFSLKERYLSAGLVNPEESGLLEDLLSGALTLDKMREKEACYAKRCQAMLDCADDALIWGGLPEVLQLTAPKDRISYLEGYKDTYLEKDIRALKSIADLHDFSRCLTILAHQNGQILEPTKLASGLGIHYLTFRKYLSVLEATNIVSVLYPYLEKPRRRLAKSPKVYFFDLGLVSYLNDFYDLEAMIKTGVSGHRFETFIFTELLKAGGLQIPRQPFYFWRSSSGTEIDFVAVHERWPIPIEAKFGKEIPTDSAKPLAAFRLDYDLSGPCIVVYRGNVRADESRKILYLPVHLLF